MAVEKEVLNHCPRVKARVFCDECGYSKSEALYTEDKYQKFYPHIPNDADFKEYRRITDEFRNSLITDPPSRGLGNPSSYYPEYEDGVTVKWVCKCGRDKFHCYYKEGGYRTFVKCLTCGYEEDVHTG